MKKADVINKLGGVTATARALGISQPSVSGWAEDIPELRAYQLSEMFPHLFSPDQQAVQVATNDE